MITDEKKQTLDSLHKEIDTEFGDGSIFSLGSKVGKAWPHIPTGVYGVDHEVIGIGGIPRKRITEIYGPASGGKTTLCLKTIGNAQRLGGNAGYIDAENALDPTWAAKMGVNVDKLDVVQPKNGEEALAITEKMILTNLYDIIIVDSVAALVPKSVLEGDWGDANMGAHARLMAQACTKLTYAVAQSNCALVFINQLRDNVGVTWGSKEKTTGGRSLAFYASLRLDIRRTQGIKEGEEVTGNLTKIKAAKNKLGPPFRETMVEIMFDQGFFNAGNLLKYAVDYKVVKKDGNTFSYKTDKLGVGFDKAAEIIASAELEEKIRLEILEKKCQTS